MKITEKHENINASSFCQILRLLPSSGTRSFLGPVVLFSTCPVYSPVCFTAWQLSVTVGAVAVEHHCGSGDAAPD